MRGLHSQLMMGLGLSAIGFASACVEPSDDVATGTDREEIVGGTATTVAANPWQVALTTGSGFQFCGGTIANASWIVTAQHCVADLSSDMRVVAGITQVSQQASGQIRVIDGVTTVPGFVDPTVGKDIALLHLSTPLTFNGNVQPIPLLTVADNNGGATNAGVIARVTGWGTTSEGGSASNTLLTVDVPIVSNAQATQLYGQTITADQVAAGVVPAGGRDSCQGDSGGPFTVSVGGVRKLAGAVSWGNGCARGQFPGLYARVTSFEGYIPPRVNGTFQVLSSLTGLSGARNSFTHRSVTVPAGTRTLSVIIRGGTGDADLYVRQGAQPTTATFNCRPFLDGNSEFCSIDSPGAGTWFFSLRAFAAYSGASATVAVVR